MMVFPMLAHSRTSLKILRASGIWTPYSNAIHCFVADENSCRNLPFCSTEYRRCNRYANIPFSLLQPLLHFYLHQHAEFKWSAPSQLTVVQSYKAVHATRIPLNPLCIPISHRFPALHSLACTSPLFFCIGSPSSLALGRPTFLQSIFWVTSPDIPGWHLDTAF